MTILRLIGRSYRHYFKGNVLISLGIAISSMVITGALIIGDSVKYTLEKIVEYRLGDISQTITAGERLFTVDLNDRIKGKLKIQSSAILKVKGIASVNGGELKTGNISVYGIDRYFGSFSDSDLFGTLGDGEAVLSENLARRLNLRVNDYFLLNVEKAGVIPLNTPFVANLNQSINQRIKVKAIADRDNFGQFNLLNSQTAPLNIFVNLDWLNKICDLDGKVNVILIPENNHDVFKTVKELWLPEDISLAIKDNTALNQWVLSSERVFIENQLSETILSLFSGAVPVLTYFVNSIRSENGNETPYSFVASMDDAGIKPGEIRVNNWLADDLKVKENDSITLNYFIIGPLKELIERKKSFIISGIVPIQGEFGDPTLMPSIPGLSDAGNCRDWETDIPINLSKIRDKDEEYWNRYKGTPKAFISLTEGRELWQNRFGNLTSVRIKKGESKESQIIEKLIGHIDISDLGFQVNEVKKDGISAARNGTDFGQLFLGLSFFILLSGIILTSLLIVLNISQRTTQIGTFSAIGYTSQMIRNIFLLEGILTSLTGTITGIVLSIFYNKLIFIGLNKAWIEIIRTNELQLFIKPSTLTIGFIISLFVPVITYYLVVGRYTKRKISLLQRRSPAQELLQMKTKKILVFILPAALLIIAVLQILYSGTTLPVVFFLSGILFLLLFYLVTNILLIHLDRGNHKHLSFLILGMKNLVRNRKRSQLIILLLSLGTFVIVSTGSYRKDLFSGADRKTSGTGGFQFIAETTIPVLKDLNNPEVKREFSVPDSVSIVQFRALDGDDASCLNLNRISNPRILGVNPGQLSGRFSFLTKTDEPDETDTWKSLNQKSGKLIPAVADETVIKWGLGKKAGDTLTYLNAQGDTVFLKLIGGLANSVFQGNVLIADTFFTENFPYTGGSKFFLIENYASKNSGLSGELDRAFRDYGWIMQTTVERLSEFSSIENTYLQIFLILGSLGLLLGTVGLIIVLAKSVDERKNEIALLVSTGFTGKMIFRLFFIEYSVLLLAGIISGAVAAIISVLPVFISGYQNVSIRFLVALIGIIILNGIIWIALITRIQVKRLRITEALRNE